MNKKHFFLIILIALLITCWFIPKDQNYACLPMKYNYKGIPVIPLTIEGRKYPIKIDIGYGFPLILEKDVLKSIVSKRPEGRVSWKDLFGGSYSSPEYTIFEMKLGAIKLNGIDTKEVSPEFLKNTTLVKGQKMGYECEGSIGRPIFEKIHVLMDFPHMKAHFSNNFEKLKKSGVDFNSFTKIPFEFDPSIGILLYVDTDVGRKKLVLDTGSSVTGIKSSQIPLNKSFSKKYGLSFFTNENIFIGGKNFGKSDIFLLDFVGKEFDGVLGMNFLKNRMLYLDFENQILYLR